MLLAADEEHAELGVDDGEDDDVDRHRRPRKVFRTVAREERGLFGLPRSA
jgi:hypothetical protein